jgi:hypothetical protein
LYEPTSDAKCESLEMLGATTGPGKCSRFGGFALGDGGELVDGASWLRVVPPSCVALATGGKCEAFVNTSGVWPA